MVSKKYRVTTPMPAIPDMDSESELNLFDPQNPDINLFNIVDDELIRLSGSKLEFYKLYVNKLDFDEVYQEVREKVVSRQPLTVFGHYEPTVLQENLTEFGIEITNDQVFIFNKSYINQRIHRDPIPGDVIKPHFQDQRYEIYQVQEDSFESYGVYHLSCYAKLLRDTEEVNTEHLPDILDDNRGVQFT
jgi:hypothetical protein